MAEHDECGPSGLISRHEAEGPVADEQARKQRDHGMIEIHILSDVIICVASGFARVFEISRCNLFCRRWLWLCRVLL
jgi:hypothetical protein